MMVRTYVSLSQITTLYAAFTSKLLFCNAFLNPPVHVAGLGHKLQRLELKATEQSQDLYYAAAGKPSVDMNKYNIPLNQIVNEWTALLTPKTPLQAEGIYLDAKNKQDLFVDTLKYTVKREGGLGLILSEIAGGREDGVGITIVEEIVDGSNSENTGILPGDSIVALAVSQYGEASTDGDAILEASEERIRASTECLGYDATIDVLTSLPPPSSPDERIELTVKRIRKQPKVNVKLQFPPDENEPDVFIELFAGENLRRGMLTRGVKLNDVLSRRFDSGGTGDCGAEGTCATCLIGVTKGAELLSPMKQQEEQILADKPKWRMACKTIVGFGMTQGDITLMVNPKRW